MERCGLACAKLTRRSLLGGSWQDHPRIRLRLDTHHPIYAAHHQKIVCIDGALAFSGGIDLTVMRWDSPAHRVDDPLRRDPDGAPYGAVHDIQIAVQGEAAGALVDIVCERWRRAQLPLPRRAEHGNAIWPPPLMADFTGTRMGLARTFPRSEQNAPIEEIAALTQDTILAARTYIYIEAQYLTAPEVAKALAKKLGEAAGPDIVIVVTRSSRGRAEQFVMGRNRLRLLRRLTRADRHRRLRIYYPAIAEGDNETPIHVHAKLMIIDDRLLRIGSANLNNRSMGLDTECDVVLEAEDEAARAAICKVRERLMAEHLGTTARRFAKLPRPRIRCSPASIVSTTPGAATEARRRAPLGPTRPVWGTFLLDPRRPIEPLRLLQRGIRRAARWPILPRLQQYFRQAEKS